MWTIEFGSVIVTVLLYKSVSKSPIICILAVVPFTMKVLFGQLMFRVGDDVFPSARSRVADLVVVTFCDVPTV